MELANTAYPEAVMDIHLRFIAAGAQIIEMNSCGANQYKLEAHGVSLGDVPTLNSAAINLAREAREVSGKQVNIAGSIGLSGLHMDRDRVDRGNSETSSYGLS